MTTENTYDVGDLIDLTAAVTDANGAAVDPTTIVWKVRGPSGNVSTYNYPSGGDITRTSLGNFKLQVSLDQPGEWIHQWRSTGAQAGGEGKFYARRPEIS